MKYVLIISIALALSGLMNGQAPQESVSETSIKADLQTNVCENDKRAESVKAIFTSKGTAASDIKVEKFDNVENITVTKKGKTDETIIVGAHFDKASEGCGVIDNWSGIVIIANLYASFREVQTEKTFVFVAFGKEEKGLIGSRAMAKAITKEQRQAYCAMVNFDSFGLAYPQVLSNTSSSKLTNAAKELATEVKMPFSEASLAGVADADSSSFLQKEIPAITFHGLSDRWQDYIHSSKDQLKSVNIQSVLVGYRYGRLFLNRIDGKSCSTFRK